MKISIRRGVFETNSSSTHSLTVVPSDRWEEWVAGLRVYAQQYPQDGELVDFETAIKNYKEYQIKYRKTNFTGEDCRNIGEFKNFLCSSIRQFTDSHPGYTSWVSERSDSSLATFVEKHQLPGTTGDENTVMLFGEYGYDG